MSSLVISQDTVSVRLESQHLELVNRPPLGGESNEFQRLRIPLHDIDRVVVCGRPDVTVPVLQRLMILGIPTFFLTSHHKWIGALSPDNNMNAERRIRQYETARDGILAISVARRIVNAKIRNSRRVVQRLAANRSQSIESAQSQTMDDLARLAQKASSSESLDELRGVEGMAAAVYFARLSAFFPENIPFVERSRRPPKNPANALLSWTYTILLGEVEAAVRSHGLDPCIGFLHSISHGTPSLALDLLEPLRAPACDMLALHLLNHKVLTDEDFFFDPEDGGTYLKPDARKKFFFSYETSMTRLFSVRQCENHVDFRKIIELSVLNILKALRGDTDYEFFIAP